MTGRYRSDRKLTPFEQRTSEPMGLQAGGTIKVYTPEEWKLRKARLSVIGSAATTTQ